MKRGCYHEIRESEGFWLPNALNVGALIRITRMSLLRGYSGNLTIEVGRGVRLRWAGVSNKSTWGEARDALEQIANAITREDILARLTKLLPEA